MPTLQSPSSLRRLAQRAASQAASSPPAAANELRKPTRWVLPGAPKKSPAVRQGFRGSCDRLLGAVDRRSEFGSGLLRLIAIVEGEQRLPSSAEMIGPEAVERMRPLRCEQRWRCERLDLLIAIIAIIVMIAPRIEVRPVRQLGARRP